MNAFLDFEVIGAHKPTLSVWVALEVDGAHLLGLAAFNN